MNWIWSSHGQQLRSDVRQSTQELANMRNEMRRHQQQMGLWGQQMKAIQTTIRYSLAGAVTYGTAQAISGLTQFERKMGDIAALATEMQSDGSFTRFGNELNQLADSAIVASNRLITPVENVQSTIAALISSMQDVPRGDAGVRQLNSYTDAIVKLSQVAEVEGAGQAAELTRGVLGMANSLGRGPQDIPRMADILALISGRSMLRGPELAGQVGRLSGAASIGQFTPEQMAALLMSASTAGGSPAVMGRGITQLMRTILNPNTPKEIAAYRQAGLTTNKAELQGIGGMQVLKTLLAYVRSQGGVNLNSRRVAGLSEEDFANATGPGDVGISGPGAKVLFDFSGRAETLQQFAILLKRPADELDKLTTQATKAKGVYEAMFQSFADEASLSRAANAASNFRLQFVRNFQPVLDLLADGLTAVSDFSVGHQRLTQGVAVTAATGYVGSKVVSRILRKQTARGRATRLGMFGGVAQGVAQAGDIASLSALAAEAGPSLISGIGKGDRNAPLWVFIHPLSWSFPGTPDFGGGGAGGNKIPPVVPFVKNVGSKFARFGKGFGALSLLTAPLQAEQAAGWIWDRMENKGEARTIPEGNFARLRRLAMQRNPNVGGFVEGRSDAQQRILGAFVHHQISAQTAETRLKKLEQGMDDRAGRAHRGGSGTAQVEGQAEMTVILAPTPELAAFFKTIAPKGVQVKLWDATRPRFQGKDKSMRRGRSGR